MFEDWQSGECSFEKVTDVVTPLSTNVSAASADGVSCGWEEICFCGIHECNGPVRSRVFRRPSIPAAAVSRRLNEDAIARPLRWTRRLERLPVSRVLVIFGTAARTPTRLLGKVDPSSTWAFMEDFNHHHPWAQRQILAFCQGLPEDLKVHSKICWMEEFRTFLDRIQELFPPVESRFPEVLDRFVHEGGVQGSPVADYILIQNGVLKASWMTFSISISSNAAIETIETAKSAWDAYVENWNRNALRHVRGAWHFSSLWVQSDARKHLISSTAMTLVVVLVLAFCSMLIFTGSAVLSLYVVLATVCILLFLAFFIIVIMDSTVGPLEIIALIVFLGYAVTYSLHIAHKYSSTTTSRTSLSAGLYDGNLSSEEAKRTCFAVRVMGAAAFGSAVTTGGCALFLLGCTLTIFRKLGGVVLVVTCLSLVIALGPLPAWLLVAGPRLSAQASEGPSKADGLAKSE